MHPPSFLDARLLEWNPFGEPFSGSFGHVIAAIHVAVRRWRTKHKDRAPATRNNGR